MNKNSIVIMIIAVLVVGGGAFYGGMVYGKSQVPANSFRRNFQTGNAGFGGGFRTGTGGQGQGMGAVAGDIISKNNTSLSIGVQGGGSKLVLFSSSTPIRMTVDTSPDQLQTGKSVIVNGTQNSDGSITAQAIQIRTSSTPEFGQRRNTQQ